MSNEIRIIIPLLCRTKKNGQQIVYNPITKKRKIIQGVKYLQFEKECGIYLRNFKYKIEKPINLKCTFYVPDRIRRDLSNLLNAIQDVLVKYEVLKDDNYKIIRSVDGSRVIYEKGREETIIEISEEKDE